MRRDAWMPWLVSLTMSAAIVLAFELTRRWRHDYSLAAKVLGAAVVWLAIAAVFRFVAFLANRGTRRDEPPPSAGGL
jgi:hypothetical protein